MAIEIREVQTKSDLKTFVRLPEAIHKDQENWVHPLYADELKYFDPAKNKAFGYCDVIRLLAYRDGVPAGRIMGIINKRFNEYRKEGIARFGYFETREDADVFHALLSRVEEWARTKGMTRIIGPYGFSDQDPEGWITEGFENRATIATYYNYAFMLRFIEAEGYTKDIDYFVYKVPVPKQLPEFYVKIYERIQRKGQFTILEFTKRKELRPWIIPLFELMNECYVASNIYGYAPLDHKEMTDLADRYLPIVDPRFVKIVTKGEEVVSFIIAMPDMTAGIRAARGRLFPFGFVKILRSAKKTKQLDLLLGAIKEKYRGLGLDVLMGVKMLASASAAGKEILDTHHEMESNVKVRAEMERMGGILYKKFRVYQKNL